MEINKINLCNRRYLGSKQKLIPFIQEVVSHNCTDIQSIMDVFGGTGVVANSFNQPDKAIIVNDLLTNNYYTYLAWFSTLPFRPNVVSSMINKYNVQTDYPENYFSLNFQNTYFSDLNCRKIGFIRQDIEEAAKQSKINEREKAILITSLLYAMDRIANTVGHYDAYRKNGELDRVLELRELDLPTLETNQKNQIFQTDANELVKKVKVDLIYLDPPYNSRQYRDAYHVLENVAEWKQEPVYGVARKGLTDPDKSSQYCLKNAPDAFADLVASAQARYILVSYNNMGQKGSGRSNAKISDFEILDALTKKGSVQEFKLDFKQFNTGKTKISNHQERLFLCVVGEPTTFDYLPQQKNDIVKSPLNYTGGKTKLLPQILPLFPPNLSTFIDLFGGGFNVGVNVGAQKTIYNDQSEPVKRLIDLFYIEKTNEIIHQIEQIITTFNLSDSRKYGYEYYHCQSDSGLGQYNKTGYYELRTKYNSETNPHQKDLYLLVLVIYSFNNQIRFNAQNEFNMPVGKRDFNASTRQNLLDFGEKIKRLNYFSSCLDYSAVPIPSDALVYCDPPYLLGTASYNESDGWSEAKEIELLNYLKSLNERGIKFALSNVLSHKGQTNTLLANWITTNNFYQYDLKKNYQNSNYHLLDKSSLTQEVLVTNYNVNSVTTNH